MFTHNTQYRGHGAAVEYIPAATAHTQTRLMINRCNFTHNGAARGILYIAGSENRLYSYLQDSVFVDNEGVPIFLSQQNLHITGDLLFKQNIAISCGGIFSSCSTVVFKSTCNMSSFTIIQQ